MALAARALVEEELPRLEGVIKTQPGCVIAVNPLPLYLFYTFVRSFPPSLYLFLCTLEFVSLYVGVSAWVGVSGCISVYVCVCECVCARCVYMEGCV
jgi:hypothetical protein